MSSPVSAPTGSSCSKTCWRSTQCSCRCPAAVEELPTLADALGGDIGLDNRDTFALVRDYVDDMILLSEEQIAACIVHAFREERLVTEGSGSVGIAALLEGLAGKLGNNVAVVVSGRNIDMDRFLEIVGRGEQLHDG